MAIEFNPITWRDGESPDISADNLNRYETVIPQLVEKVNAYGVREVRLDLENITIPANGYYPINNLEGYPELAAGEKMITQVGNWGSTSPVGAFSVNNKYVFGEPNMTITSLYVLFYIFR